MLEAMLPFVASFAVDFISVAPLEDEMSKMSEWWTLRDEDCPCPAFELLARTRN